jgi:hypothetical protein
VRFVPLPGTEGGFALGHLRLEGEGRVNSETGGSRKAMMVYPSASLLLQHIGELLAGSRTSVEYVGTGSSFTVRFIRKGARVSVRADGVVIGSFATTEVFEACLEGAKELLARHPLPADDLAFKDLTESIAEAESVLGGARGPKPAG